MSHNTLKILEWELISTQELWYSYSTILTKFPSVTNTEDIGNHNYELWIMNYEL